MSQDTTAWRPFTRMGWGGKAASHFRGPVSSPGGQQGQLGTVVFRSPGARVNRQIVGVTRDSTGAVLGGCGVDLYATGGNSIAVKGTVSDAGGNFTINNPGSGPFYIVAYKPGSPDVAGTTVNTLVAV